MHAADPREADTGTDAIIALDVVSKSFDGGRTFAVGPVSLEIRRGSFVAMVGASGSGKTTLLKLVNRLIEADAGTVRLYGRPAGEGPGHILRRRVGYVFQDVGLFPHMTVTDNVGVTPKLLGWPRAEIAARVAELLSLVDLPQDFSGRLPDALSGGQRQRVGIARALAARPDIMLMDEPFGALDPVLREALGQEYRRIHDDLGLTTMMVTHDVVEAVLLADRILVLRGGCIVADGAPHALLTRAEDAEVRALMDMPRRQAARVGALIDGIPGDE
jgi:osmoprotectant transport system ATP-binding protein